MISRALLFGVAFLFSLAPAAAMATTTPTTTPSYSRPTCMLSVSQGSVALGKTVNLSWQSQHATQGFITSIGTVGTAGTQGVIPTGRGTTYVGTFTGPGGTGTCSVTVSVNQSDGSGGFGDNGGTVEEPDKLPPSRGGVSPTTLPPANDITLSKTPSKGLVPCGNTTGLTPGTPAYYAAATSCQACSLASLAQKIINFLLGLSIPLAAVMFAYAGVIYFSSGVEMSVNKVEKAHAIFRSVGIGFMIVLAAWLGVNTVLKTVLDPNMFKEGSWFTIQCVGQNNRPMDKTIDQLLSVLPGLNTNALTPVSTENVLSSTGSAYACESGYSLINNGGLVSCDKVDSNGNLIDSKEALCTSGASPNEDGQCTDNNGNIVLPGPTYGKAGELCSSENPACSAEFLQQLGYTNNQAVAMSCIAMTESSGDPSSVNKNGGACGTFQILPSNWKKSSLHTDNCSSSTSCNDYYCNAQAAFNLSRQRMERGQSPYGDWTCPGCNSKAQACIDKYDPGN